MKRRTFIHHASVGVIGSGVLMASPLAYAGSLRRSANDLIQVGLIGCRGMGWANLTSMLKLPNVQCKALCDIDKTVLAKRKQELADMNVRVDVYEDYRKMLEDKDIDVVIIATPDHWHCLQLIDACAAGKDVFVEKPVSNSIAEAQMMVAAVKRYNRVVQVNQWQRSQTHFKEAVEFVKGGSLGRISSAKTWMYRGGTTPLLPVPDEPVPEGVNYDLWLGPAKKRAFNSNRFHYEFRWFWDYAGGLMTDWGVHLIDMVLMAMNVEAPTSIMASGGKMVFPDDARETPDIQTVVYDYGGFQLLWEHNLATGVGPNNMSHGIAFIGEHGTLLLNRGGWEVQPHIVKEVPRVERVPWKERSDNGLDKHCANFIDAVRDRDQGKLNCPIEAGARVAINCHMGNIAWRTREKLQWDPSRNKFNSAAATKLLTPEYHNGWKFPKV